MTLLHPGGVFAAVTSHFADPLSVEDVRLTIGSERGPLSLSPSEAHEALHGPDADPVLSAAIWREVIRAARSGADPRGKWQLLLVWLLLPRLGGTVYRVSARLRTNRADVESEMVLALLETLEGLDPEFPGAADALTASARGSAWRYARSARRAVPVGHIESIARDDSHPGAADEEGTEDFAPFDRELEVSPPDRPDGLSAPLRITVTAAQVEAVRLGALAHRFGLPDAVLRTRGTGRRRCIGRVSLRPDGRRR
ncbi:hypothetical protein PUR49_18045 [Streptomyces sp. BE147]|uniref:hypothetical protein n=1 Tax=Streptomyces sp. BE147 TaxID=3002524 RepID=UPI002E76CAAC|nr:hypothetical protein [Streptomyces sp. BE147]MEE1738398.1 hypothetical protein [Streptomyces sp. BE147]